MIFFFLTFTLFGFADFSTVYEMPAPDGEKTETVWEVTANAPFDELILSWNAPRSPIDRYTFFVSLRQNGSWSPWLYYGDWGNSGQMLPVENPPESPAQTNRGMTGPKKGTCDAFRVQIFASDGGNLSGIKMVSASLSNLSLFSPSSSTASPLKKILLDDVPRQSLHTLRLARHWDMSMVASMLSAVRYLSGKEIDAADFAAYIMDNDFESYDFWPLHAAEAFVRLEGKYKVRIERLADFAALHAYLARGVPVLVNIQGSPLGSMPWPPYRHHILCVIGYDPENEKVICLDPAFPSDKSTYTGYSLYEFMRVWAKRQNIACVFEKNLLSI